MPSYKLVISDPKTGLTVQREVKDPEAKAFMGKKIGDALKGDAFGLAGYEFMVTGGSDYCGFPMRKDVSGIARKRILAVSGVGVKKHGKGVKQRKTVCGNVIYAKTVQINLRADKLGKDNIFAEVESKLKEKKGKKEKPAKEEKKAEEKKEAKKEKPAKEEKPEKKEEKKAEKKEDKKEDKKDREEKK